MADHGWVRQFLRGIDANRRATPGQTGSIMEVMVGRAHQWWTQALLAAVMWMAPSYAWASDEHRAPDIRRANPTPQRRVVRLRIPMTVHVATAADRPAVDTRRLMQALNRTNQELAAHGIEVYIARLLVMPEGHAGIRGRRSMRR